MIPTRRNRLFSPRTAALAGLLAGTALAMTAGAAEVVILKDGFLIQGNVRKEHASVVDPATGKVLVVAKDTGLDMVDEGPKVVVFSSHARQLGEIGTDVKLRPDFKAYTTPDGPRRGNDPFPPGATLRSATEFNAKWVRTLTVNVPLGIDRIEQQITYLDPYYCYIWSSSHRWRLGYRTTEMDPAKIRKLLSTHPDLVEESGKPDAAKRVAVARFMLDAGWLQLAREDLNRLKKDFPDGVPNAAKEAHDKLVKDTDTATAALVVKEGELALGAGRYDYAGRVLSAFPEKLADATQTKQVTEFMARWKAAREQYANGRRLLRAVIDEVTGNAKANPLLAAGGGPAFAVWPARKLASPEATLASAAEEVYRELHPDSAQRIEVFVNLAAQVEKDRRQGRDPSKRADELLAAAVSGWVKGKSGATAEVEPALKLWAARETVLRFQRSDDLNTRNEILKAYKKSQGVGLDELQHIVSLLPPAEPEDLLFRAGTPVEAKKGIPEGVYKRKTPPTGYEPGGLPYLVKLPPEYHHGRAYPVLIVLTDPGIDPEHVIGSLVHESDRHGYILLAPEWTNQFGKGWQWRGQDHECVTAVLRDAVRHFCIDNDRVFLFGHADGGSMAMDIGASHPDLFAGVLAMSPTPKWQNMFINYWQNAQKLPFYVVTGELAGESASNTKLIYQKWTRYGFPGVWVIYKGRGIEWYAAEPPVMFDWMSRKKRVPGVAILQLGDQTRYPFVTMRPTDNRFYWLGVDKIYDGRTIDNMKGSIISPATIIGDIGGNNVINVKCFGIQRFSIWLSHEMIDWTKPVTVNVNGSVAPGWRGKNITPDINVLLEDYRERGDRRMLFLQRLEFNGPP
jgi:pimeloyl-ACP methyl ester carboxylesterase